MTSALLNGWSRRQGGSTARVGRPGVVPSRLHPYRLRSRLRPGTLDARPAAPDGRGPDRLRDPASDRGQPAPYAASSTAVRGRRRGWMFGGSLDGRGRATPSSCTDGDPQHRPMYRRAQADGQKLQQGYDRSPDTLAGWRTSPSGARDADRASQHGPLFERPGRRQDHGPHRGRREPPHGLLPRHHLGRARARAVGGGVRDRR